MRKYLGPLLGSLLLAASLIDFNSSAASASSVTGQLDPGDRITSGTQLVSPNGVFVVQMQADGNFVERTPGNVPVADTNTAGNDGAVAVMQGDGNFVIRAPGNIPIWATATDLHPGAVLQVQDDGAVDIYGPGHRILRVIFPPRFDSSNSVGTPHPGAKLVTPEPGTDGSQLSNSGYEGATELFCSAVGKASGEVVGDGVAAGCGVLGDSGEAPMDGYEGTRILGCSVIGKIPVIGVGLGPACDILTSDEPAG